MPVIFETTLRKERKWEPKDRESQVLEFTDSRSRSASVLAQILLEYVIHPDEQIRIDLMPGVEKLSERIAAIATVSSDGCVETFRVEPFEMPIAFGITGNIKLTVRILIDGRR